MPKKKYIDRTFQKSSLVIIATANEILEDYDRQGFRLTLRQLYYQFVARDLLPNTQRSYKRLGSIVNDGRLAGLIDWNYIEDRTRGLKSLPHWSNPADIVASCAAQFRVDKWATQPRRVEVWVEKDALAGVLARACEPLDVPFLSTRGYLSQSEMWHAANRATRPGQSLTVIHLTDHDPSGLDMREDVWKRFELMAAHSDCVVNRIALTMDQVEQFNPPPNPAKVTDSRYEGYSDEHGDKSWELDALEPAFLVNLVQETILAEMDNDAFEKAKKVEREGRKRLAKVVEGLRNE